MSTIEYGTVGQVEYCSQRGEWSFLKRASSPQDIIALGGPIVLLKPCLQDDAGVGRRGAGRQSLARRFAGNHTEFVPAVSQIIDIYEESAVVEDISQWALSKTSPLIAIAYAGDAENLLGGTHPLRKILAYATGANGSKLAASVVQLQRFTRDDKVIRRPSLKPQDKAIFTCSGPIEQLQPVYETETGKTKPWVVIRTQKTIYLIRIAIEFELSSADVEFSATCMATIESSMVGGNGFLHIAVNPWQGEQIAVVDTTGTWSVWTFTSKRSHRTKLAPTDPKLVGTGRIYPSNSERTISWANIAWGCSQNELLIATRSELFKLDIEKTESRIDIYTSLLESTASAVEIINLRRSSTEPGRIIVLTNYTLHVLELDELMKPVLMWRHCRHPEDRSLCCAFANLDNDLWILLYSRYNPNITILRVLENNRFFDLSLIAVKGLENPLLGLELLEGSTEHAADKQRRTDVFTIIGLGSKYEIWKQDCTVDHNLDIDIFRRPSKSRRASWKGLIIDTNGGEDLSDGGDTFGDLGLGSTFEKLSLDPQEMVTPGVSILNFESLYEEAFDDEGAAYKSGDSIEGQSFTSSYLGKLRSLFNGDYEALESGLVTCLHVQRERDGLFDDPNLLFTEIQRLSSAGASSEVKIVDLEPAFLENDFSATLPVLSRRPEQVNRPGQTIVAAIYDALIKTWLESLPPESPAKTRLRRERLARMLSIDIGLSSLGACHNVKRTETTDLTSLNCAVGADEVSPISTPLRIPLLAGSVEAIDIGGKGIHGIVEAESRDYPRGRRPDTSSRLFLETFTPVTHTGSDPDIGTLLNDWDVGQAPDQYQWRQLSSIQQQAYEESQRSSSRSRSRAGSRRRRAASIVTAEQGQDAISNGGLPMTQPVTRTEITTAFPLTSSQVTSGQRFPSSQVQRGYHGDSRKMKKRRTEGF